MKEIAHMMKLTNEIQKNKTDVIKIIEYHVMMPYMLSLHELKGVKSNLEYHKIRNSWVFNHYSNDQIEGLITDADNRAKLLYN